MKVESNLYNRLGLIGWPISHSLSPTIHAAALDAAGLSGEYQLYPVDPDHVQTALEVVLSKMRTGDIHGLNVTVPHKERVLESVDTLSEAAAAIGAVNTLVFHAGEIRGENTDAPGFLNHLQRLQLFENPGKLRCAILGAGGSARAVAYALATAGHEVAVAARRETQARKLVDDLSRNSAVSTRLACLPLDFHWISDHFHPDLLVNTTPLGMQSYSEQTPWPEEIPLPEACVVYDLIYNPAETLLLRQARRERLRAINGLGMLVEQAAISFSLWTGIKPPIDKLYQAVGIAIDQR